MAVSATVAAPDACEHADAPDAGADAQPPPAPRWRCDALAAARDWAALSDAAVDERLQARTRCCQEHLLACSCCLLFIYLFFILFVVVLV